MRTEQTGLSVWPGGRPLKPGSHTVPAEISSANVDAYLADNDIKYILAQFVDIHGVAKSKAVPASHVGDLLTDGAGFAGAGVWGMGMAPHEAEYMVVCDLGTLIQTPRDVHPPTANVVD